MPQTQNPYAYSLNNPVNFSDPSGEDTIGICRGGSFGAFGFGSANTCIVYCTTDKSVGIVSSVAGGGSTGVTSGLDILGVHLSNADSLNDLKGKNATNGVNLGVGGRVSIHHSYSKGTKGQDVHELYIGAGPGGSAVPIPGTPFYFPGYNYHGGVSHSEVVNLNDLARPAQ